MDELGELLGESPAIEMVRDKLRRLLERQRAGQDCRRVLIQVDNRAVADAPSLLHQLGHVIS